MPRLRARDLPHSIVFRTVTETAEGKTPSAWSEPLPAYVEQKTRLIVDRRATSATSGQEITSTTRVILLPENDIPPTSQVKVWAGTPRERTSEVIASAKFDYDRRTPNHVQLDLE
jgi:hypothetical protein